MSIEEKLSKSIQVNDSLLCIGLDSDIHKLPNHLIGKSGVQFEFNKAIIDATHDLVCAYKPNSAFYEGRGSEGIEELKKTCDYIREKYPDIITILDAKRGDIGSTNEGYIEYSFDYLGVDAITLHPYLGRKALQPFLDRRDKGCIILCRTSNPGAEEFQDLIGNGTPLYQSIAHKVATEWNTNENCMLVVGATYPDEMKIVRKITGDMTFLVPGIGAQGGDIKKTMDAGINSKKMGMLINSSRSVIFASNGEDFAEKSRIEAIKIKEEINTYR